MIAQIAVDSGALAEPANPEDRIDAHDRIIEQFREFGALRLIGRADARELFSRMDEIPEIGEKWGKLLVTLGAHNRVLQDSANADRPETMRDLCERDEVPIDLLPLIDLVLASSNSNLRSTHPEVTTAKKFDLSATMKHMAGLRREMTYPRGTPRTRIWAERWEKPAAIATEVTVCDPYLFGKDPLAPGDKRRAHVIWLLNQLNQTLPPGARVRLLAEKGEYSMCDVAGHLDRSEFPHDRPGALDVFTWTQGKGHPGRWEKGAIRGPHDRHIRFSCGVAYDLPSGFDRLRGEQIDAEQGFKCTYIGPSESLNQLLAVERAVTEAGDHWEIHGSAARKIAKQPAPSYTIPGKA